MKIKIIVGVVVLLLIGLFVGNWIVGNRIAEELDTKLRDRISKLDLPFVVTYSDIDVSPLSSKAVFKTVVMVDDRNTAKFTCDALSVQLSAVDILKLSQSDEFEEISSFQIELVNPLCQQFSMENEIKCGNIKLVFDGHITKGMLKDIESELPSEKQRVVFSFSDLEVDFPDLYREMMLTSEQRDQISRVNKANIVLNYLPESKEFVVEDVSISTPIMSSKYVGRLKYSGSGLNDFEPVQVDVDAEYSLTPSGTKWSTPDQTGRFGLSKLLCSIQTTVEFDERGKPKIPEGEFSFLLENLTAEFSGRLKKNLEREKIVQFFGIDLDDIGIEKFSISSKLVDNQLTVWDTELLSQLFSAVLSGDLLIDDKNPDNSIINNAKLVISNLSPELELSIAKLEKELQQSLPRDGKDIVLEFSGRLGKPEVKGLNL